MSKFDVKDCDIAWCPGCGNFGILNVVKKALEELEVEAEKMVLVSGIGQAAKVPQYVRSNFFNGLHGRALPAATAIKASNPSLLVIAESGEGDTYGEGGNHFIHTIRRNPDITNIVHNNMVYGLTKGQASPTSQPGFKTPVQVAGVFLEPFNPLAVALALDAGFVARVFIGDPEKTKEVIKKAILHKGYALVDVLQPCVTFNKLNTYTWFRENTYNLDESYDSSDRCMAFKKVTETGKLPLGVFYAREGKATFEDNVRNLGQAMLPLHNQETDIAKLRQLIMEYK